MTKTEETDVLYVRFHLFLMVIINVFNVKRANQVLDAKKKKKITPNNSLKIISIPLTLYKIQNMFFIFTQICVSASWLKSHLRTHERELIICQSV